MKFIMGLALAGVCAAMTAQLIFRSRSEAITISCGAAGLEFELCKTGALKWGEMNHRTVRVTSAPNNSTERLGLFMQLLASHSNQVDVYTIDVTWAGIMGDFLIDLRTAIAREDAEDFFPAFVAADTSKGELKAVPWYIDAGLLYYRTDLLAKYGKRVPLTWEELTETAAYIQERERALGNSDLWGFVFQGRAYEGLTCNAMEWIKGQGGSPVLAESGTITVNSPQTLKALNLARGWIGSIAPAGTLNYTEEEARGIFQSGKAIFLRSWPYVSKLAGMPGSAVRGKFGFGPLPGNTSVLGGWSLAVSKYSRHVEAATDLILYLSGREEQLRRAIMGGFFPTRRSLYQDSRLTSSLPNVGKLHTIFANAFSRPSGLAGSRYNRLSAEFWESVHDTLAGNGTAESNMAKLGRKLGLLGFQEGRP